MKTSQKNKQPHILILSWRDIKHPLAGGAEISLFEHARYWHKKGCSVSWFASSYPKAKKTELIDGIHFIRRGSHYTVHFYAFIQFIRKRFNNPDVVVDAFHFLPFFTPLYMRKTKKIALLNEVAGILWFKNINGIIATVGLAIEMISLKYIYAGTTFITGSQSAKKSLKKLNSSSSVDVVHHGVNKIKLNKQYRKEKDPTILFLGRIAKDKGIKDAIEAFRVCRKNIAGLKLWVAGKEEEKGAFKKFIHHLKPEEKKNIIYFGFISEYKKHELYRKSWILIHPSTKEGWGLTVIEAASQETPTVGYDVEGLCDSIKHDKTGILTKTDSASLASGIEKIILDSKKLSRMRIEAKKWSENFSWEKSVRESWKIIQKNLA